MKKKILFVSHDASRTGAPIVFRHLIQWVKEDSGFEFTTLLRNSTANRGALTAGFEALGPVIKWPSYNHKKTFFGKISGKLNHKLFRNFPGILKKQKFDLIYLNTVESVDILPFLKQLQPCPVILHVHENEFSIKAFYAHTMGEDKLALIDHYIAASESTRQNLVENLGIPEQKTSLVYEFVPVKNLPVPTANAAEIANTLKPANEFIVGGSGTGDWRKGIDLFIQVASLIKKAGKKIKFVWVGNIETFNKHQVDYELKRLGLDIDDIIFTGSVSNPQDYFRTFDVFTLTSREDPFPLVCLEAASLAKPIICFAQAGGMPELVSNGGGIIVPYADVKAMADAILDLYNAPEKLVQLGAEAKEMVQQYDVSVQAPKILDIIDQVIQIV